MVEFVLPELLLGVVLLELGVVLLVLGVLDGVVEDDGAVVDEGLELDGVVLELMLPEAEVSVDVDELREL